MVDEIPIEVELQLNKASFKRLQRQLEELGQAESEGTFTPGQLRHAAIQTPEGVNVDVAILKQFRAIEVAAQNMAAQMELAADAARRTARGFARTDLRDKGRIVTEERVAEKLVQLGTAREVQRIGGVAGTVLGTRGTRYDVSRGEDDETVFRRTYDLARDRARIRSRQDAYRVAAQIQTGFAPNDIQFEGEAIRARKSIQRYFKDVAAHLAAGNQDADLEHLVNTYDPKLLPKARRNVARQERLDHERALTDQIAEEQEPLEEAVRIAAKRRALREKNNRLDEQAAREEAEHPGTLSPTDRAALESRRGGLLRQAEVEQAQQVLQQQRTAHARAMNAYFGEDVPFSKRFSAGLLGNVPGGVTQKQPFGADFLRGLFGREGTLEGALGQAVKFSVLYGSLYRLQSAVSGGFAAAATSASQYEDALVALSVATGKSVESNEELASSTSRIATAYGYLPNQGVTAAAQAVGLYGLNDASDADRLAISNQSTAVAARIGRLSGQDIGSVQQNVAGLIRSFNLPALDQGRVEDMLSVVQRQTGSQPGDLLNAATQLGEVATEAGYDLADTFAMISQAQRMTGQSAAAVAGQLSQGLSRAGDPSTKAAFASVGIDVTGTTFKQQVSQLAALRPSLDPDTYKQIVQSVGRSRSGATFDVLLSQQSAIQGIAGQARGAAPGSGEANFNRSLDTLSGQLLQLKGHLAEIGVSLAQTGILTVITHVAVALNGLATILENLVGLYSELPKPLRDAITYSLEFAAVIRLLTFLSKAEAVAKVTGGLGSALGGLKNLGNLKNLADLAKSGGSLKVLAGILGGGNAVKYAVPGAGALPGAANLAGGGALASAGPAAAIIAALATVYGIGAEIFGGNRAEARTSDALTAARRAEGAAGTSDELVDAAARYREVALAAQAEQDVSLSSFMKQGFKPISKQIENLYNDVGWLPSGSAPRATERQALADEDRLRKAAQDLKDQQTAAAKVNPAAAFSSFSSADAVSQSLQVLGQQGYGAKQQLDALNLAFEDMIAVSKEGVGAAGVIKAGMQAQFTQGVAAVPGKAIKTLVTRYTNQREAFAESPLTRIFGGDDLHQIDETNYKEAQQALDALNGLDTNAVKARTSKLVTDVLATAPRDRQGQILLTRENMDAIKAGARREIIKQFGPNLPKPVLNALVAEAARQSVDALSTTVSDLSTPEGILAYAQNARAKVGEVAQDAGTNAILTSRENTAEADATLAELQRQRANVVEAAKNLPVGQRAAFIASQTTYYDGEIRKAVKASLQGRYADIDAATKVAQSGHAIDDDFGRFAEQYLADAAKFNLLKQTITGGPNALVAASGIYANAATSTVAKIRDVASKTTSTITPPWVEFDVASVLRAAAGQRKFNVEQALKAASGPPLDVQAALKAAAGPKLDVAAALKAASGPPGLDVAAALKDAAGQPFDVAAALKAAATPQFDVAGALQVAAGHRIDVAAVLKAAGTAQKLDVAAALKAASGPPRFDVSAALDAAKPPFDVAAALKAAATPRFNVKTALDTYQAAAFTTAPTTGGGLDVAATLAGIISATTKPKIESGLTQSQRAKLRLNLPEEDRAALDSYDVTKFAPEPKPVEDTSSPEYFERLATQRENDLKLEQFRRQDAKNKTLLGLSTSDTAGIDQADIDQSQALLDDALRRQKADKASGKPALLQETNDALVRQRRLNLREQKEKLAHDQANIANQNYELSQNVDDPMLAAKTALDLANRNLDLALKNIGDLRSAQLAHRKAQQEVLDAQVELDAQMRDDYDRTDPVAQAQAELDKLNAKLAITRDPKARKVLSNQIEDKTIDRELADSTQRIKDIDDLESLGKITKASAQAARVAEKNRVDAELAGMTTTTTGYRALKDRSIDLAKEIKSASDQYAGQFNIRDIKLPTVYEIRRSLGTDRSDITNAASNVTNNTTINGADFARVVAYLNSVFGKQVGRTRSVATRTVG